mmetsp:Transcript_49458/g.143429  ORF Transcript_49458/g.143429 Transcript_49458/m.143429 type:complete len:221 (+) Transcript_49458:81-743(+)
MNGSAWSQRVRHAKAPAARTASAVGLCRHVPQGAAPSRVHTLGRSSEGQRGGLAGASAKIREPQDLCDLRCARSESRPPVFEGWPQECGVAPTNGTPQPAPVAAVAVHPAAGHHSDLRQAGTRRCEPRWLAIGLPLKRVSRRSRQPLPQTTAHPRRQRQRVLPGCECTCHGLRGPSRSSADCPPSGSAATCAPASRANAARPPGSSCCSLHQPRARCRSR